jgi:hypothetical protein
MERLYEKIINISAEIGPRKFAAICGSIPML